MGSGFVSAVAATGSFEVGCGSETGGRGCSIVIGFTTGGSGTGGCGAGRGAVHCIPRRPAIVDRRVSPAASGFNFTKATMTSASGLLCMGHRPSPPGTGGLANEVGRGGQA